MVFKSGRQVPRCVKTAQVPDPERTEEPSPCSGKEHFLKKSQERIQEHKAVHLLLLIPVILAALAAIAFFVYVSSYYRADAAAEKALVSDETTVVSGTEYGWFFDGPSEDTALVFYPGGKVEEKAYAPLLHRIAAEGMDVCLVKMPFRLAVLDKDAAKKVMDLYSYSKWYVGGHSLGGVMAASYAAGHEDGLEGIILFAAYPTKKIPPDMTEILIVGSEDKVIRWDKIEESRQYAPGSFTEHIIEGGNHAQFGSYGEQKGDGTALVSADIQVEESVRIISETLLR